VQVVPKLSPSCAHVDPGLMTALLELKYVEPSFDFTFRFKLRRYNEETSRATVDMAVPVVRPGEVRMFAASAGHRSVGQAVPSAEDSGDNVYKVTYTNFMDFKIKAGRCKLKPSQIRVETI